MSTVNAKLYATDGSEKGTAALPDELFAQPVHEHLMWLSVKRYLGNQRQGTAKVKTRGEVSGGGRAFGPKPRDYRTDMPKKQRRAALASALSLRASENAVTVVEPFALSEPKTAVVAALLKKLGLAGTRTLLVVDQTDERVWKSVRNVRNLETRLAHQLNPYDLLASDAVVFTAPGLARVTEVFVR